MNRIASWLGKPLVPDVSTETLARSIEKAGQTATCVIDVRSSQESAVSVIPSAITLAEFQGNCERYADHRVYVYCTLGGRSLLVAGRLKSQGFDAYNYRDGILGWCAAGNEVVTREGVPTKRVHTFSRLLKVAAEYESVN